MFKKIKNRKGFTLIELIVVIAILAVLAALIVPSVLGNLANARLQRDLNEARTYLSEFIVELAVNNEDYEPEEVGVWKGCDFELDEDGLLAVFDCTINTNSFSYNSTSQQMEIVPEAGE